MKGLERGSGQNPGRGAAPAASRVFYTALYHALLLNLVSDVNGEYPLMERSGETGVTDGERYTVFSLWDTCRNLHQLLTLVYPDRQREMLRSMTGMYEEWGWLPLGSATAADLRWRTLRSR